MQEWMLLQEGWAVYGLLFVLLMGGAIGLPIPEDLPLILGGFFAQAGKGRLSAIAIVCYSAIILGDMVIYSVGRVLGPALFNKRWFKTRVSAERMTSVKVGLEKRSLLMIFIARHLFYLRTVTFLTCGAVRMSIARFLIADAVAALVSVPIMLSIGYLASEHYENVIGWFGKVKTASLWVGLLVLVTYCGYRWVRNRSSKKGESTPEN